MRFIFSFTLLILPLLLFAQPPNDDCANLISVNIDDCLIYNNMDATIQTGFVNFAPTGLGCTPPENEVWFAFTGPPAGGDGLLVTVTGVADGSIPPLLQPSVAVLLGDCPAMFMEATACEEAALGSNTVQFTLPGNLIPGFTYYVVVGSWSATATPNEGAFEFCVETYVPPTDICSGSPATITDCSGMITDSGGDSGDYGPNENCVFTISPTAFSQCIVATVNFYNTENFADFINFYDGPTTASPQIQSISGVGANLEVQASSGSLTIEFTSDGSIEQAGFEIEWTCTTEECTVLGPVDANPMVTVDDLVDALSSPQVIVENPILNCPDGAYGTYTSPGNTQLEAMGLPSGVVLSSGLVESVENTEVGPPLTISELFFSPGDADLDALSTTTLTNDACVLEFDVYAATDELEFQYVFGSEEYTNSNGTEFINTNFNDIFAFFISGPGIAPNTNIAVLQDGITEVSINTVNDGSDVVGGPIDPTSGEVIYVNNIGGLSLPYGGHTTVLTARADVIPCNYYHLKLAIADRGDSAFDSGVFIGDLSAGLPQVDVNFAVNSVDGENILIEGCSDGSDIINATIENPNLDTFIYYISVGGTADEALDLATTIPDSLIALPGTTTFDIPFEPTADGIAEGIETLDLEIFAVFECDTVVYSTIPILIYDDIDVEPSQDTFYVCTGTSVQLEVGGATAYTWGWPIPSELNNPNLYNPTLTPSQSGTIYVSGIINGNSNCVDMDSAYIQIIDPTITIITPAPFICENESVQLDVTTNTNNTGVSWSPATGLSCIDCPNPIATPSETTTYTATVTAGGCTETDEVIVTVEPLGLPDLIDETLICEGSSIILASEPTGPGAPITSHLWSPDDGSLDDPTSATPNATPAVTTTYTVVSTTANGACSDTQSVVINVAPATIEIDGPDSIYQCNNTLSAITLNTTSITIPGDISWTDSNGNTYPNGGSLTVNPSENIVYYATITVGACTNYDSVVIQIDSLPDFVLDVSVPSQGIALTNPDTVDVCANSNESFIVTNSYNAALYPEMNHEWLVNGTSYNPMEEGANLLDNLPFSTSTYVLTSNNNACSSLDSFVIDVNTPPNFGITPSSAIICPGDNVQLEATGVTNFTWIPDDGSLSDININNPIATPNQTTTYTAYSDIGGCQAGVSMTITVLETPNISLINDATICVGQQITLGSGASNPNFTYTWLPNDFLSGDGTASPIAAPLATTTYSVTVSNGVCDIVENVTIVVGNDLPLVVTGDSDICSGESTTLSANTQGAVNWFDATGSLIATGPTLVLSPTTTGTVTITAEAFDNFCSSTDDFTITINETPTVTTSADQSICEGESVDISAATDIGTLAWTPSNEFPDPSLTMQTVSPNGTTTYIATADNNGCEATGGVTITVSDAPIYAVLDDWLLCEDGSVAIGLLDDPNTTYSWVASPADPTLDPTSATPVVAPTQTTTYTLTATNGLCTETDAVTITYGVANTSIAATELQIVAGESSTITVSGAPAGSTYSWVADSDSNPSGDDVVTVTPEVSTNYTITITTPEGCTYTETIFIEVAFLEFDVPNIFTPNNDGTNDDFFPIHNDLSHEVIEFKVFDRWGELVHDNNSVAWDGTYNNKPATSDIYVYFVRIRFNDGTEEFRKGDVALMR